MTPGQVAHEAFRDLTRTAGGESLQAWEQLPEGERRVWEATAAAAHAAGAQWARLDEARRTGLAWLAHVRANLPGTPEGAIVAECAELTVQGVIAVLRGDALPAAMQQQGRGFPRLPIIPNSAL